MRNLLLTSTAAACLLLAGPIVHAQDHGKKDEQKQEHVQRAPDAQHLKQEKQHNAKSAAERSHRPSTTGQATENSEPKNKNESAGSETKPGSAAAKPNEKTKAQDKNAQNGSSKNKTENKSAADQNKNEKSNKANAATEQNKTNAATEQNKTNAATEQNKTNAASGQNKTNESSKSAQTPNNATKSNQENAAAPNNKSNTANTTNETNTRNSANTKQQNTTVNASNQQISQDQKVKISETISQHHNLAAPERNLRISINVGERVPPRIHLHPLPREIVTIAPEYRGYDYFTTEEDVVIVSPRTHEIVTRIPRDVSRARAEVGGGGGSMTETTTTTASSGGMPCQVMRRTASGDMSPISPSDLRQTTGSGGNNDRLAVKVQAPNGQQMPEVALQQREGRIIAETDGSNCRIILEPGNTR